MHLRTAAVLVGIVVGLVLLGWGAATTLRPARWNRRVAHWWVVWTAEPVGRGHGAAVAVFGAGLAVSGIAGLLATPAAPIPPTARGVQLVGLGLVLLGGAALVATHPAPPADPDRGDPWRGSVGPRPERSRPDA